jgi:hypothetical protein
MNTNKHIIYYNLITELQKFLLSSAQKEFNLYLALGKSLDWDGNLPPDVSSSVDYMKKVYNNFIYMKKISVNDISSVIERIDWNPDTYYDCYDNSVDLSIRNQNKNLIRKFYVRNKFDQVFKCLWNNINVANTYNILDIINHNDQYLTIKHEGGTYDVGEYVTIDSVIPNELNQTLKVINSSKSYVNVAHGNSGSYFITTSNTYISGGTIKSAVLTSEEPVFDTGSFDRNEIVRTSDGYKWKYLYTIDKGAKLKFFDNEIMPLPITLNTNYLTSPFGFGSIDVINVKNGGVYQNGTNTVNVIIRGDGTGATAEAFVNNNTIKEITVTNPGKNYTYANISIEPAFGTTGYGAEITHSISPIGGHGFNLLKELFSKQFSIVSTFSRNEEYNFPTDIQFNQISLLYNPFTSFDLTSPSQSSYVNCMIEMILSYEGEPFKVGELVYQGINLDRAIFKGSVVSVDDINNTIKIINVSGTAQENYKIKGTQTAGEKIVQQIFLTEYIPYSGDLFYHENIANIQRDPVGTEQIRIFIDYTNIT